MKGRNVVLSLLIGLIVTGINAHAQARRHDPLEKEEVDQLRDAMHEAHSTMQVQLTGVRWKTQRSNELSE